MDTNPSETPAPIPRSKRRDSVSSNASFYSDVEMAQDEVFAGPTSESLPSSVATFHHRRRPRSESVATVAWSFYEPEPQDLQEGVLEEEAIFLDDEDLDLEAQEGRFREDTVSLRRRSSEITRASVTAPLLRHRLSESSERGLHDRVSQKFYIHSEDLTIVITGFVTSRSGYAVYISGCILTLGMLWLLMRWFPHWRVWLTGTKTPLKFCDWVVIQNQWDEYAVIDIQSCHYGESLSSIFGPATSFKRRLLEFDDDDPPVEELRYIDYRYIRFYYHQVLDKFKLNNHWRDPNWESAKALRGGLDGDVKSNRRTLFGQNVIDIEEKTITQLLVDEAVHPFYVFQIASLILWSMDEYYYYAACIFIISVFSIAQSLIDTRSTMRRLREVARFECDVRVLRNGFWRTVSSAALVPGDVYELTDPALSLLPCDSLLLTGDCIVNESMLTGESVPVSKSPVSVDTLDTLDISGPTIDAKHKRHFLYCGTKIIRARRPFDGSEEIGLALAVKTGFNTTKGALVRSMLFPKPSGFKFYRDSFYYIGVMGIIAALGFIASFINFIKLGLAWHLIIVRALDLITIVVPPALPATLTIGTSFALARLKKRDIFCISPQRVNVSGKLDIMCFDKTGTLTEDGLDVLGVHCVETSKDDKRNFSGLLEIVESIGKVDSEMTDQHEAMLNTMATCHSLRCIDDELMGDPLDLKMFEFTGWEFEEGENQNSQSNGETPDQGLGSGLSPSVVRPAGVKDAELGILRIFEFDAALRRSSVVVKKYRASGGDVYVKGAPECMKDICTPESFPTDFDSLLQQYTHRGYRVIACATKHIKRLSWIKAQKMKRKDAESQLQFCGFIVFENKLKDQTTPIIDELGRANIRRVMCTGDNILTAISVAKNCHIIEDGLVFVPHFQEGGPGSPTAQIRWQAIDDDVSYVLDDETLLPRAIGIENDIANPKDMHRLHDYSMAVNGEVFRWVIDYARDDYINKMLVRGQVFARMSPDEKQELVEKLQGLNYTVGFCGDGANDCGALKAADVGISLSEAEASVAAPFTSRVFDISCVPELIREGRAALVTSFTCFKYMSIYSAIQFTSVSILYKFGSNLGDFQFLFIDLFLILPIAVFMGWTGPYPVLSKRRPTASLVSRKVLIPLLGQISISFILQFISYKLVKGQSWYIPPVVDENKSNIVNSPNTTLFLFSCYQYIFAAVILSVGPPFRQPMARNLPFIATIFLGLIIVSWMLFDCPAWLYKQMQLTPLSTSFKAQIFCMGFIHLALGSTSEQYIMPWFSKVVGQVRHKFLGGKGKARKKYKVLDEATRV